MKEEAESDENDKGELCLGRGWSQESCSESQLEAATIVWLKYVFRDANIRGYHNVSDIAATRPFHGLTAEMHAVKPFHRILVSVRNTIGLDLAIRHHVSNLQHHVNHLGKLFSLDRKSVV